MCPTKSQTNVEPDALVPFSIKSVFWESTFSPTRRAVWVAFTTQHVIPLDMLTAFYDAVIKEDHQLPYIQAHAGEAQSWFMQDALQANAFRATRHYQGHLRDLRAAEDLLSPVLRSRHSRVHRRRLVLPPQYPEDAEDFDALCTLRRINAPTRTIRHLANRIVNRWITTNGGHPYSRDDDDFDFRLS